MDKTFTENRAVAYRLRNKCLELFSTIGGMMSNTLEECTDVFTKAYVEDPKIATQVLFYSRGARKGSGLKKVFKHIFVLFNSRFIANNLDTIINNGCAKDVFIWLDDNVTVGDVRPVIQAIASRIRMRKELGLINEVSPNGEIRIDLLLKWFPRKGWIFRVVRRELGLTNKELRKILSSVTTVETLMSAKKWDKIDFNQVPGGSLRKYYKAWQRHCEDNFEEWKNSKDTKANVSATYPHQIVEHLDDATFAQKMWDSLPNYLNDVEKPIVICDTSGSMHGQPMDISVSLGIYCSERIEGPFKDKVVTFSEDPHFHDLSSYTSLGSKWDFLHSNHDWGMNTDFEKTYKLILDSAKLWNVTQDQMPTMIICISDMQFDEANADRDYGERDSWRDSKPHHENMKRAFEDAGYKFPKLVYWNVRASYTFASPADDISKDTALISGFNPSVIEPVLKGDSFNPMKIMYQSIEHLELDFEELPLS